MQEIDHLISEIGLEYNEYYIANIIAEPISTLSIADYEIVRDNYNINYHRKIFLINSIKNDNLELAEYLFEKIKQQIKPSEVVEYNNKSAYNILKKMHVNNAGKILTQILQPSTVKIDKDIFNYLINYIDNKDKYYTLAAKNYHIEVLSDQTSNKIAKYLFILGIDTPELQIESEIYNIIKRADFKQALNYEGKHKKYLIYSLIRYNSQQFINDISYLNLDANRIKVLQQWGLNH